MPPKKGKKKKSGKKSKKSSQASAKTDVSNVDSELKLSNEGKNNFLIQTKDLERQIDRLQRECDDLEIVNSMFEDEFKQTDEDKNDIVEYLERTLNFRIKEIKEVKQEYEVLEEQREKDNAQYEEQINEKMEQFENIKEELESEKRMKSGQLQSLEEFKVQKEELNQKFADIEDEIRILDEEFAEDIYQKERANVVEMERLKKEMATRVTGVATEFRKVSNRQMTETNKKTIQDNVNLSRKIKIKSEETLRLLDENERLRGVIDKEQKLDIQISQTVEKDLRKKYDNNVKAIKTWINECRNMEDQLTEYESEEYLERVDQIQMEKKLLEMQTDSQMEELTAIQMDQKKLNQQKIQLEQSLQTTKDSLKTYKRLINRTKNTLIDAENLMDPNEEFTEGEVLLRRQRMMDSLLLLLNSAANLGFGINPSEFAKNVNS